MRKPRKTKAVQDAEDVPLVVELADESVQSTLPTADTDFVVYETTIIPEVREVRLYADTVKKVRMGHREVPLGYPSMDHALAKGLTKPTHILSKKPGNYLFIDATSTNSSGDPMRMPVKIIEGTSARLQSVYFASTNEESPDVIWRSDDDDVKK